MDTNLHITHNEEMRRHLEKIKGTACVEHTYTIKKPGYTGTFTAWHCQVPTYTEEFDVPEPRRPIGPAEHQPSGFCGGGGGLMQLV